MFFPEAFVKDALQNTFWRLANARAGENTPRNLGSLRRGQHTQVGILNINIITENYYNIE